MHGPQGTDFAGDRGTDSHHRYQYIAYSYPVRSGTSSNNLVAYAARKELSVRVAQRSFSFLVPFPSALSSATPKLDTTVREVTNFIFLRIRSTMAASSSLRVIGKALTPNPRPVEMLVLVLGLSRTSTYSMAEALDKLGYKTYHMKEVFKNFEADHIEYWRDGLHRKYCNKPGQYKKSKFDKILAQ